MHAAFNWHHGFQYASIGIIAFSVTGRGGGHTQVNIKIPQPSPECGQTPIGTPQLQ